ncbi:MAG: hypothetical protein JSV45_13190 [Chromatiales bacterium]|nr:MAG: hypothetical protein JSV45_13190 [Chromatiales bacterium]
MPANAAQNLPASLPEPARFVPYGELGTQPNVIVDGPPQKATVLTLSHWPNNDTPAELKRDTSTAIAFAYLDTPALHREQTIVSNSHFDEDGLFSMFALVNPALATRYRELLVDASRAGDFGVFAHRDAARLAFTVEAFTDPEISPLPRSTFAVCERRRTAHLYAAMLERLPAILADLDGHAKWWREQDDHLEQSLAWLGDGTVGIEERPAQDLAVVRIPLALPECHARRYLHTERAPLHPFAIHQRTQRNRLLRIQGQRYELQYRYESWVQVHSHRPALRVNLQGLADELNDRESAPGTWCAEGVMEVAPRLYLDGVEASGIPEREFVERVCAYLESAPVAWDPYDWPG